jgi:hypothetical protein
MKPLFLLSLLPVIPAFCQPVSVGAEAGIPLDRTGSAIHTSVDKERWIGGPTIEIRLPRHFGLGVDALYRRINENTSRNVGSTIFFSNATTNHWEFPIYLKYRFGEGPMYPFVLGGGAFEHASVSGTAGCAGDPLLCGSAGTGTIAATSLGGGYLLGGGVEFRVGRLKVAPEFRYTRWVRGYFAGAGSDQPALLVGIRF